MHAFSVTEFLDLANNALRDFWDQNAFVIEGEVTDFRVSRGQWVNFSMKDEEGLLPCFMVAYKLNLSIQDGMKVRVYGYPRIYPKYGKFSFNVDMVELVGEGDLQKALKLLREKLEKEGFFDPERKRVLPRFPQKVALVASTESAAYGDFIRIINERWRGIQIDAYHVLVQGQRAPKSIIQAIEVAQKADYDALILTRGGGSLEELMAFNDEGLVRALHGSRIPTLVGIGHERDTSLAEDVADVRASTPTDCARRLVPDRADILYEISMREQGIANELHDYLDEKHRLIQNTTSQAINWMTTLREKQSQSEERLRQLALHWFQTLQERVESLTRFCGSFDPTFVLKRGYAYIEDHGKMVTSIKTLKANAKIKIHLRDGARSATINKE